MKLLNLIAITFGFVSFAVSQNTLKEDQSNGFSVNINRDTILLGNAFDLIFNIENLEGKFEAPDLSDFNLVMGPNRSSSMSVINGNMMQKTQHSYRLEPRETGKFYIQASYLETKEGVYETAPLTIIVLENPEGIVQKNQQQQNWMNFGFRSDRKTPETPLPPTTPKKKKLKTRKF